MVQNTAARVVNFTSSICVNTHLTWSGSYQSIANVQDALAYLGIKAIRDSVPYTGWTLPEYQTLASMGVRFNIIASGPTVDIAGDVSKMDALAVSDPGSIIGYEGPNEYNSNSYSFNGASSMNNPAWGAAVDQAMWNAVSADIKLSGVNVIGATMANATPTMVAQEGNVSNYVSDSAWHVYFNNGQEPAANVQYGITNALATALSRGVWITETGNSTYDGSSSWGSGGNASTAPKLMLNTLADAFKMGANRTFIYELLNDNTGIPASSDTEGNFGLFTGDGTPKPSAIAIHNLTTILADNSLNAASFTPGSLNYSISNLPSTGNSMLLEKGNSTFDLMIWNEPQIWSSSSNTPIVAATTPVTVGLGGTYGSVKVFDPLAGTSPVQTLSNVSSVSLNVVDHPLIVEIGSAAAASASNTFGSGADTLVLNMSEDAYANNDGTSDAAGNAAFTVKVDGVQQGGTLFAAASHSAGQQSSFTFRGNWGSGAHTVGVTFLNDAYKGKPSTDRNLYVNSASYDGAPVPNSAVPMLSGGTVNIAVPAAAAPSITMAKSSGQPSSISPATVGTAVSGDATFLFASALNPVVTLGTATDTLSFNGMQSVTLVGGAGTDVVKATSGSNTFTAGLGSLDVTGGSGAVSYAFYVGGGMLKIEDFSAAKGDSLTVDAALKSSMTQAPDGHGGTMLTFGMAGHGVDLVGMTSMSSANIRWV